VATEPATGAERWPRQPSRAALQSLATTLPRLGTALPCLPAILFLCLSLLSIVFPVALAGAETVLFGEFWCELEPMAEDFTVRTLSQEEAIREVLDEALYAFSGMVYGFSFSYTPSDIARGVDEIFVLEPLASVRWGDPALSAYEVRLESDRYLIRFRYDCSDAQEARRYRFFVNPAVNAMGMGRGSQILGTSERITAVREAVKEAVRDHLRRLVYNKPREIVGEALFSEAPRITLSSGRYVATVRLRLIISEIVPYSRY